MVNRRAFLGLGGLAAAGLLWDPELWLWRPPKTFVFLGRPLTISMADVAYERVLRETMARGKPLAWSDSSIIRVLARKHTSLPKGLPR